MKKCMEYRVEGRRPVGRPRKTWLESVVRFVVYSATECLSASNWPPGHPLGDHHVRNPHCPFILCCLPICYHTTSQSFFPKTITSAWQHGTSLLSLKLRYWLYLDQILFKISVHIKSEAQPFYPLNEIRSSMRNSQL